MLPLPYSRNQRLSVDFRGFCHIFFTPVYQFNERLTIFHDNEASLDRVVKNNNRWAFLLPLDLCCDKNVKNFVFVKGL